MVMDPSDVETLVVELYRAHDLDPREPESPWRIARLELGASCFDRPARVAHGGSGAYKLHGRWRIAIARNLPPAYAAHAVGHELGHAILDAQGVRVDRATEERLCDQIGGAILAPAPAVAAMYRSFGFNLRSMAREAAATQTWAALRLGEALGIPTVVLSRERVRVRGPVSWVWPPEPALRGIAKARLRGVRRDLGAGRTAFFADETAA